MAKMKPVGDLMLYWKIGEDAADVKGRLVLKENKLEKDKQTKQVGVDDEKKTQQQNTNSEVQHELADPISKPISIKRMHDHNGDARLSRDSQPACTSM